MEILLNYDTSPLNPALKIIIPLIFVAVVGIYLYVRRYYSLKIRNVLDILLLFAVFIVIAAGLRYFGDGTQFGFTKDYSLRWFQSLAYVAAAGFFVLAGYKLFHLYEGEEK
ncbi:MAG: hypothetical protein A4E35_00595 [Methanoregula sp. PtaU1.Bin051]|nr:MAG: hypothetical protein A4E35_00595 [Methanoregula sp. PtaU1.Bin051]